jgi:hypothetical protein
MAYQTPQANQHGEEILSVLFRRSRDWGIYVSQIDFECPGTRAITTRFVAAIGGDTPLPDEHPSAAIRSVGRGKKRVLTTLVQACINEACISYEYALANNATLPQRRSSYIGGLFWPVLWCMRTGLSPVAKIKGEIVADLQRAKYFPPKGLCEDSWSISENGPLNPLQPTSLLLQHCVLPEFEHLYSEYLDAILVSAKKS